MDEKPRFELKASDYVEGLTAFDLHRPKRTCYPEYTVSEYGELVPATVIVDVTEGENFGGDEVKCSICLGVLERTCTVTACLHRFCSDCLHRSLRTQLGSQKQHHECPLCRAKLASRRASKPDPHFDSLIGILMGEKVENSDVRTSRTHGQTDDTPLPISAPSSSSPYAPSSTSLSRGGSSRSDSVVDVAHFRRLHQLNVKKFRDRQQELKKDVKNVLLKKSSFTEHSSVPRVVTEFVSFSLQPFPMKEKVIDRKIKEAHPTYRAAPLRKAYLKTDSQISVKEVKLYLTQELLITPVSLSNCTVEQLRSQDLHIYTHKDDEIILVEDSMTLHELCSTVWDRKTEFRLYFSLGATLSLALPVTTTAHSADLNLNLNLNLILNSDVESSSNVGVFSMDVSDNGVSVGNAS